MVQTVLLIGPTGSGKGTQAERLARLGFHHISSGDLIRAEIAAGGELGLRLAEFHNRGELAPSALVDPLWERALAEILPDEPVLLDGVVRTASQVGELDRLLAKLGRRLDRVVLIGVSSEEAALRLESRRICPVCHRTFYRGETMCPHDQSPLEMRPDDTPEAVREKLRLYEAEMRPVLEAYQRRGLLREVDGSHNVPEVARQVEAAVS